MSKILEYIHLENFKNFGEKIEIKVANPTVLIGPNNCGKTSILQALTLWSIGLKTWSKKKSKPLQEKKTSKTTDFKSSSNEKQISKDAKNSTAINRLSMYQLPIQNARYLWKNTEVRKGNNKLIEIKITLGIYFKEEVKDCTMIFTQQSSELIYCIPAGELLENKELLDYSANIQIHLLYPMSGLNMLEKKAVEGTINTEIGQGKTSEVLRNLCYNVFENNKDDWKKIVTLMKQLFQVDLLDPNFEKDTGYVYLQYKSPEIKNALDISLAGRGFLQFLLLFSYLFTHKNSILLLDEPDAHLEILRQRSIYYILTDLAKKNSIQLIIATHSEVVVAEAQDVNLEFLLLGKVHHLADKKDIKNALIHTGIEHYLKAEQKKTILFIEGRSDLEMLKEFAILFQKLDLVTIIQSDLNYYYIQNNEPERTLNNDIERIEGSYNVDYRQHFKTLKKIVPNLKGISIIDGDGKESVEENFITDLQIFRLKKYELENYFINPITIDNWKKSLFIKDGIFKDKNISTFNKIYDKHIKEIIFENILNDFETYNKADTKTQLLIWGAKTNKIKLSLFFENLINQISKEMEIHLSLKKKDFYKLIQFLPPEMIDEEIKIILNKMVEILS